MKILFLIVLVASIFNPSPAQALSNGDIEPVLQQMQNSGKISAQEAEITRRYMQQMNSEDWNQMEKKASDTIERNTAAAEKLSEEGLEALDGADFEINNP